MTDLTQDIFLKRPVSEKPGEDGEYMTIWKGVKEHTLKEFKDGQWQTRFDWTKLMSYWLQPIKLQEVLGSLEIPRWVKCEEKMPDKEYSFGGCEFGTFPVRFEFEYRTVINIGYLDESTNKIHNANNGEAFISDLEWLSEGNLSDLLYKVAEEAYDKGFADAMENDSPDKAQYLSQFRGK